MDRTAGGAGPRATPRGSGFGALDLFDCNCGLGPSRRHRPGLITDATGLQAELDLQGIRRALVYAISAEEYFPRHGKKEPVEDVLGGFVGQFYTTNPPPRLVLLTSAP